MSTQIMDDRATDGGTAGVRAWTRRTGSLTRVGRGATSSRTTGAGTPGSRTTGDQTPGNPTPGNPTPGTGSPSAGAAGTRAGGIPAATTGPALSRRDRALLAAVDAGRCDLAGTGPPDLRVDGLWFCDQARVHVLLAAGLLAPTPTPGGGRTPRRASAALTDAGRAVLRVA
jgi:hypothetical protein